MAWNTPCIHSFIHSRLFWFTCLICFGWNEFLKETKKWNYFFLKITKWITASHASNIRFGIFTKTATGMNFLTISAEKFTQRNVADIMFSWVKKTHAAVTYCTFGNSLSIYVCIWLRLHSAHLSAYKNSIEKEKFIQNSWIHGVNLLRQSRFPSNQPKKKQFQKNYQIREHFMFFAASSFRVYTRMSLAIWR